MRARKRIQAIGKMLKRQMVKIITKNKNMPVFSLVGFGSSVTIGCVFGKQYDGRPPGDV